MGRMTGAAGFKRDSVASRGGKPDPGLTGFTYNDPNATVSSNRNGPAGLPQTSYFGGVPADDQLPGAYGMKQASPMSSSRRSFTSRVAAGAESTP